MKTYKEFVENRQTNEATWDGRKGFDGKSPEDGKILRSAINRLGWVVQNLRDIGMHEYEAEAQKLYDTLRKAFIDSEHGQEFSSTPIDELGKRGWQ